MHAPPARMPMPPSAGPSDSALAEALRVARRVGADPALVLHGGGNTSVKILDNARDVLWVKGSGSDLATVVASNYTPLDLAATRALLDTDLPDNAAMYQALEPLKLDPAAPRPSIETLMHAALEAPHVIHTHTDSVLALCNSRQAAHALRAALGDRAPLVPYRHSGVALARACREAWRAAGPAAIGLVLDHHGALAVGGSATEACERTLRIAGAAEAWLVSHGAPRWKAAPAEPELTPEQAIAVARLRESACRAAGRRLAGHVLDGGDFGAFIRTAPFRRAAAQGPSTPGHAIFTKRYPLVDGDVARYAEAYRDALGTATCVDCAPRVIIDPRFGMLALGVTPRHARIAAEVFVHDAGIMARAEAIGGYATVAQEHLLAAELEYAGFEARVARDQPHAGEVHLLDATQRDAAGTLVAQGAAVALLDATVRADGDDGALLHLPPGLSAAAATGCIVARFGGIDHTTIDPGRLPGLGTLLELRHA